MKNYGTCIVLSHDVSYTSIKVVVQLALCLFAKYWKQKQNVAKVFNKHNTLIFLLKLFTRVPESISGIAVW